MHPVVGRLRGRACPAKHILDRLAALSPHYRVHWMPVWAEGPGKWVVAEHRDHVHYREVGKWRLARFEREGKRFGGDKLTPSVLYGCELMIDGDHIVAVYDNLKFGSDEMFRELETLDAQRDAFRPVLNKALQDSEDREVKKELDENDEFWRHAQEVAKEDWGWYMRGRRSVGPTTALRTA